VNLIDSLKEKAENLEAETYAIYLASKDRRTPWYAKAFLVILLAYIVSPIDLIPDFIPVLGYLDELVIVPVGIFLALKMLPRQVMADCRAKAISQPISSRARWLVVGGILIIWLSVICLVVKLIWQALAD
jgi:uncharacterized membrane protein YkvA (DUF1232 family)